ncbi:hypothetical protein BJX76DRAFT_235258 [Aspergillus varians]
MVAAEKGVADSFGMTLDCQYFFPFCSGLLLCGRCVGVGLWKCRSSWSAAFSPLQEIFPTLDLGMIFVLNFIGKVCMLPE